MTTITIGNETLKVSAETVRALLTLNQRDGAAILSHLAWRRGKWTGRDRPQGDIGIDWSEVSRQRASELAATAPWAAEVAAAHPRATGVVFIKPESWDRFDAVVRAIREALR